VATVYNQAISCRFGIELADQFANETWTRFDAAVAWVRRSGIRHLMPALTDFLQREGHARFVVGIDIENTSKEGLEALLSLKNHGNIEVFVHHNEHQSVTFHPKVYLFSGDDHARLIIGSNNLTESGLFTNTEAGLEVEAAATDPVIVDMRAAIDAWCSPVDNMARELDTALLTQLEQGGYVASEDTLNRRRNDARRRSGRTGGTGTAATLPIFGSKAVVAPPPPPGTATGPRTTTTTGGGRGPRTRQTTAPTSGIGAVLLMRPRLARGTQMQPMREIRQGPFMSDVNEVVSDHDGVPRPISATHPERDREKGIDQPNTYKLEIPEAAEMDDPVLRFWRTPEGVVMYRAYDAATPEGRFIMQKLEEGRHTTPPLTVVGRSSHGPESATWYRFI
jgi:hypothetical protein